MENYIQILTSILAFISEVNRISKQGAAYLRVQVHGLS